MPCSVFRALLYKFKMFAFYPLIYFLRIPNQYGMSEIDGDNYVELYFAFCVIDNTKKKRLLVLNWSSSMFHGLCDIITDIRKLHK